MSTQEPKLITIQEIDEDDDTEDKYQKPGDIPLKIGRHKTLKNSLFMKGLKFDGMLNFVEETSEEGEKELNLSAMLKEDSFKIGTLGTSLSQAEEANEYGLTKEEKKSSVSGALR